MAFQENLARPWDRDLMALVAKFWKTCFAVEIYQRCLRNKESDLVRRGIFPRASKAITENY